MKIEIERVAIVNGRIRAGKNHEKTATPRTVIIERRRARRLSIRTGNAR